MGVRSVEVFGHVICGFVSLAQLDRCTRDGGTFPHFALCACTLCILCKHCTACNVRHWNRSAVLRTLRGRAQRLGAAMGPEGSCELLNGFPSNSLSLLPPLEASPAGRRSCQIVRLICPSSPSAC